MLGAFAGHAAPDGTLSDGDMLVALAAELAVEIPAPNELLELATAAARVVATSFADPAVTGDDGSNGTQPASRDGELQLAIASHIFSGGGTVRFDERLAALRPL
ncbi:MAG: hypothetical protein IAI49_13190, partial [Candidatus Eremiobacteraeota bacterium]|nr:hypothetical protein [Candidatus Eremiobacteraeota bacterium]